jgi:phosphohistidine phosphatase
MKYVTLLRHAKTESFAEGGDHERSLTRRGARDALTMAGKLEKHDPPEVVLTSSAARVQQTADIVAPELPRHILSELYLAEPEIIIEALIAAVKEYTAIWIIGHNPGMSEVRDQLLGFHSAPLRTMGVIGIVLPDDAQLIGNGTIAYEYAPRLF